MHELPAPVRVCLLLGYRLEDPLPTAVELAKAAALDFQKSGLAVDVRVDLATVTALQREAARGCDLLVFYGHGTDDGRLVFCDGRFTAEELSAMPELAALWRRLVGCFVFACWGDRIADGLPCPWVAFREPILTTAPKGFVHALVPLLGEMDFPPALAEAERLCSLEMASSFTDVLRASDEPWPAHRLPRGEARLSRSSPALTGHYEVDFSSVRQDDHVYPDHDPFVGRVDDLRSLFELPSPHDDRPMQRAVWVHGDAGMGKSALLREFAGLVRDLPFRDQGEEVHLLHLYCFPFTLPQQVIDALAERARTLYELREVPASPEGLARALEAVGGTHVWVLDDLTYLSTDPSRIAEAESLARGLLDVARSHALRLQLVVSTRHAAPPGFESLGVGALNPAEALGLGIRVWSAESLAAPSRQAFEAGVFRLFHSVGGSTASFKRSLLMAVANRVSYLEYAEDLGDPAALDAMDEGERATRVLEHELSALGRLESRHGFAYRRFLAVLYRLVKRAAYFSIDELASWFGDRLMAEAGAAPRNASYRNGSVYLMRVGFLGFLVARDRDGEEVYSLPPSQRIGVRSLDDPAEPLPAAVPLRGAGERLSLALERARRGDKLALGDLLEMEHDYRADLPDPEAAAAVFFSMLARSQLSPEVEQIEIFDAVLRLHDAGRANYEKSPAVTRAVAMAHYNKGVILGVLNRLEEAVEVCDEVVSQYGGREELSLTELVARALLNKGTRPRTSARGLFCGGLRHGNASFYGV